MQKIKKWGPVIILMVFIFCASSIPGQVVDNVGLGKEVLHINAHFFLYLLLGLSLYRATGSYKTSLLIGLFYGITDEIHQMYVPGRSANLFDVFVDGLGVATSLFFVWLTTRLKTQKSLLKE